MNSIFKKYPIIIDSMDAITLKANDISKQGKELYSIDYICKAYSLIDLTTLNATDTTKKVVEICEKVNNFSYIDQYKGIPNVAALCVYPALVSTVKNNLKVEGINIASVSGGFPASQTFIKIKCDETKMAIDNGANEIDMVISVGAFLEGNYQQVYDEIVAIKEVCGKIHLKVILETGALETPENISKASYLAMEAGADFIKTSTGKFYAPASIEAIYIMADAIKNFQLIKNKKVGLKPAGGISNGLQACEFISVVENFLGKDWIKPNNLRIGASSLANNLLSEIVKFDDLNANIVKYY